MPNERPPHSSPPRQQAADAPSSAEQHDDDAGASGPAVVTLPAPQSLAPDSVAVNPAPEPQPDGEAIREAAPEGEPLLLVDAMRKGPAAGHSREAASERERETDDLQPEQDTEASAPEPSAAPSEPQVVEATLSLPSRLKRFVVRAVPWVSLIASVVGAAIMDRSERRGPMVAAAMAFAWIVFAIVSLAHRKPNADKTGAMRKAVRFASTAANQSLLQMSLFFSAPFYIAASAYTWPQVGFLLVLAGACAATLWDPVFNWILLHPFTGALLMAFASFIGWNAALPMLGVSHRYAVWLAAAAVAIAIPSVRYAKGSRGISFFASLTAGFLFPALLLGGAVVAVPPAPLRVVRAAIGTEVKARELVDPTSHFESTPRQLLCWTAIRVPVGLSDTLTHVWRHDGRVRSRVALNARGGRDAGFRTWSRLRLKPDTQGEFSRQVVTSLGQTLSQESVLVVE